MSVDFKSQKLIKLGIVFYVIIFGLIALDIASDYGEGMDWAHVSVELLVLLVAVMGFSLLGRAYYQNTQNTLKNLQIDLDAAQQEAQRWRDESKELIEGLGVEIQKQFKTLVKKYHPDKNQGSRKFEDKLKKITLAYSQLKMTIGKKK